MVDLHTGMELSSPRFGIIYCTDSIKCVYKNTALPFSQSLLDGHAQLVLNHGHNQSWQVEGQ